MSMDRLEEAVTLTIELTAIKQRGCHHLDVEQFGVGLFLRLCSEICPELPIRRTAVSGGES